MDIEKALERIKKIENILEKRFFIELDKKREIRPDMWAMCEHELQFGVTLVSDFIKVIENIKDPPVITIRNLLFSCLKHEDKDLTLESLSKLFGTKEIFNTTMKLIEAIRAALPDTKDTEDISEEVRENGMIPGKASKNE